MFLMLETGTKHVYLGCGRKPDLDGTFSHVHALPSFVYIALQRTCTGAQGISCWEFAEAKRCEFHSRVPSQTSWSEEHASRLNRSLTDPSQHDSAVLLVLSRLVTASLKLNHKLWHSEATATWPKLS